MRKIILFYDGECGFCMKSVQFVLNHETTSTMQFAPLQGQTAARLLPHSLRTNLDSVVIYDGNRVYTKARAIIFLTKFLKFPYRIASLAQYVPKWPLDRVYDFVAKNRFLLSRSSKTCQIPSAQQRERFID